MSERTSECPGTYVLILGFSKPPWAGEEASRMKLEASTEKRKETVAYRRSGGSRKEEGAWKIGTEEARQ